MPRKPKRKLHRYAKPTESHLEHVREFALRLSDPVAPTVEKLEAAKAFHQLVVEAMSPRYAWINRWEVEYLARRRAEQGLIENFRDDYDLNNFDAQYPEGCKQRPEIEIEMITWQRALSEEIRRVDGPRPDQTPVQAYDLIDQFHRFPKRLLDVSLLDLISSQTPTLTYDHYTRLQVFAAQELCMTIGLRESLETAEHNESTCLRFALEARQNDWSPKKLENEIKRSKGGRGAGRPRKSG